MKKSNSKTQQENEHLFEVDGYLFRRIQGHTGVENVVSSLYSMERSNHLPNLYILAKVQGEDISVRYYYHGDIPDRVAHTAHVYYDVFLKLIYPWVNNF